MYRNIVTWLAVVFLPLTATSQSIVQSAQLIQQGTVSARYNNAPVNVAINDLARRAGVRVTYTKAVIERAGNVTLNIENATLADAFGQILKGTGLRAVRVTEDAWTVAREDGRQDKTVVEGVITGKITDAKTGKSVAGANVALDNDARGVSTAEDGLYRINGVAAGNHTVAVRLLGYAKQTRSVNVGDGDVISVDFRLEPSANVLNDVVVTGTMVSTELKAVPNAITVVTAKQIEERGITRIDQLFRGDIPGLFASERGTDALLDEVMMYSRGATKIPTAVSGLGNTNPIKTYVDGVEMADAQYLSQIDPKSIERIEILTGPQASTIYGANAINGVMQIFTKRGGTTRPTLLLNLSSGLSENSFTPASSPVHVYDVSMSNTVGKISYNTGSNWTYTGAWSPGKQMQRTGIYGGIRYQVNGFALDISTRQGWTRNKIRGDGQQVRSAQREDGTFLPISGTGIVDIEKRKLNGRTFGITISYNPVSWWSHQMTAGNDASDTERAGSISGFSSPADTSYSNNLVENRRVSQSYSSTLRLPVSPAFQAVLTYGADHWRSYLSTIGWDMFGQNLVSPSLDLSRRQKNSGAYMQGQLGLWDALFFTYGIRADWNPNYGEKAKVRPGRYGASLTKDFGAVSAKLRGSYGRSIRPPDAGKIQGVVGTNTTLKDGFGSPYYTTLPSPELGPEFQQGGEGGVELYIASIGSLVVTRYNQTVDGLISLVNTVDSLRALQPGTGPACSSLDLRPDGYCYLLQNQNLNVGSIRNQGWELQGSVNAGPFTTSGTYTWAKTRVLGITPRYRSLLTNQAFTPGRPFTYVPEHVWAVNLSYLVRETSVALTVHGIGTILRTNGFLSMAISSDLRFRVIDAQRFDIGTGFRMANAGYTTADVNVNHHFSDKIEGNLQIINLTNFYQNDVNVFNPTLGRQTRAGLRMRW